MVFVFPGQGGQWAGMGRDLAASSPVFAARLAECSRALASYVDWSLDDVLAGAPGAPGLDRADVVQPVLWAVMVSLVAVWRAADPPRRAMRQPESRRRARPRKGDCSLRNDGR